MGGESSKAASILGNIVAVPVAIFGNYSRRFGRL